MSDENQAAESDAAKNDAAKNVESRTSRLHMARSGPMAFDAETEDGQKLTLAGPAKYGGAGEGMRPMQMFLAGLAGCASIDVTLILEKQRQRIDSLEVFVEGVRADAIPAVYERIHLRYVLSGEITDKKLQRAVKLSVEKYCSVASMLLPTVEVTWSAELKGAEESSSE